MQGDPTGLFPTCSTQRGRGGSIGVQLGKFGVALGQYIGVVLGRYGLSWVHLRSHWVDRGCVGSERILGYQHVGIGGAKVFC